LTRANETKSEFVAFAAHELNNPLTSVMGWASTMRSSMVESMQPDQIQNIANVIHTNADRMQNIIKDLRDIAASDANKLQITPEAISITKIVADTLLPYQKQFEEKGQTVINQIPDNLPQVMVDPKRLIQVMTNFVSNAHKYSPEGSTITIDAKVETRYVSQSGRVLGRMMRVSVSDTGIGMSEDDLKRIFTEDYFRSESAEAQQQKGTGLGMMITKRIIEGHGGEVWVESELGKGSTFAFVIPLASESSQETKTATPEPETASD
jgi:signal transduction histidine kinase